MTGRNHFVVLDGFRGVAALAIVVLHATQVLGLPYKPAHISLAVDFFFCLSGFVIAHAYDAGFAQGRLDLSAFTRKRLVRLYPMILLGVALGAATNFLSTSHGTTQPLSQALFLSVSAALLIPGGILFNLEAFPVNTPLWSLFFEGIANVAYGLTSVRGRLRAPPIISMVLSAVLIIGVVARYRTLGHLGFEKSYWFIGGLARVTYPFLAGVLICRTKIYQRVPKVPDCVLAAILAAILFGPSVPFNLTYGLVAILILFPAIVACGARPSSSPAVDGAWRRLGELSYPLYMIHLPVLKFVAKAQKHFLHANPTLISAAAMTLALVASWAALKLYDEPVRARLSRALVSRHKPELRAAG